MPQHAVNADGRRSEAGTEHAPHLILSLLIIEDLLFLLLNWLIIFLFYKLLNL
jgi:hypothetical protein